MGDILGVKKESARSVGCCCGLVGVDGVDMVGLLWFGCNDGVCDERAMSLCTNKGPQN